MLYIFRVGFARSMNNKKRRSKTAKMYIFFLLLLCVQGSFKQWQCYTARAQGRLRRMNVLCVSDGKKEKNKEWTHTQKKVEYFNTYTFSYHHPPRVPFFFSFNLPTLEEFLFIFIYNFTLLVFFVVVVVVACTRVLLLLQCWIKMCIIFYAPSCLFKNRKKCVLLCYQASKKMKKKKTKEKKPECKILLGISPTQCCGRVFSSFFSYVHETEMLRESFFLFLWCIVGC